MKEESLNDKSVVKNETPEVKKEGEPKKKMTLADLQLESFISEVKIDQMQFLNTAGG
jgi:hypothetical protein